MSKNLLDLSLKGFKIVTEVAHYIIKASHTAKTLIMSKQSDIPNEINQECVFCDYLKNLIVAYNLSLSDSCSYPLWDIYNLWDFWQTPRTCHSTKEQHRQTFWSPSIPSESNDYYYQTSL